MKLQLWKPMRELSSWGKDEDTIWDRFFGTPFFDTGPLNLVPAMDVSENENEYKVTLEVPGVEKENVSISLEDGNLVVKGEKKSEKEEKDDVCFCSERTYGSFERSVGIPSSVDAEKVNAKFKNGVLEIVLPKKEEEKPKAVKIDVK